MRLSHRDDSDEQVNIRGGQLGAVEQHGRLWYADDRGLGHDLRRRLRRLAQPHAHGRFPPQLLDVDHRMSFSVDGIRGFRAVERDQRRWNDDERQSRIHECRFESQPVDVESSRATPDGRSPEVRLPAGSGYMSLIGAPVPLTRGSTSSPSTSSCPSTTFKPTSTNISVFVLNRRKTCHPSDAVTNPADRAKGTPRYLLSDSAPLRAVEFESLPFMLPSPVVGTSQSGAL